MSKFVGNCADIIDWYAFIEYLEAHPELSHVCPAPHKDQDTLPLDRCYEFSDRSEEAHALNKLWIDSKYNLDSARWSLWSDSDYKGYAPSVDDAFSKFVGLEHVESWVSRVGPGCTAPYHPDVDDYLNEFLDRGDIIRYTCHIGEQSPGAGFFLANECFYSETNGNAYEWDHFMQMHGGANCGVKPHWMYSFWGFRPR